PFLSRTVQMAIPPGSVFKTLTGIALMESGRFDPDEKYFCQGFLDRPDRHRCFIYRHYGVGHSVIDLTDALAPSCYVYFFHGSREVGPHALADWAARFGFGQPTGIDLPGERSGNLPMPPQDLAPSASTAQSIRRDSPWYPGDTLGLAIGQAQLTATPLQ